MQSDAIKKGISRAPARAMLKATGLTDADLARPLVAIANTWTEVTPCNFHLRQLAERVKEGVRAAGGTPIEFDTITISDGITMGTEGMKASLVSREVIADSIELFVRAHAFDAVVAICGCDKTIPGTVMALARLNLPSLSLYGGSILAGHFAGHEVTIQDVFEAVGACAAGKMTEKQLGELEDVACPGAGACGGQFTANTMATAITFLGISPMGANEIPATDPRKGKAAFDCGKLVMQLLKDDIRPRQIITRESLHNAIASVAASGGSTNAVLHLLAIARDAGVPLTLKDFDEISAKTPVLADLKPGGRFNAPDMFRAGGMRLLGQAIARSGAAERRDHGIGTKAVRGNQRCERNSGPGSGAAARKSDQARRRPGDSARFDRAGRLRGETCRARARVAQRAGARVRFRRSRVRGGAEPPDSAGRRGRDSLRRAEGRPGHARNAGGDRRAGWPRH